MFPLVAPGPAFIGIRDARYPLQVAVQPASEYSAADRVHTQVLFTSIGVLVGVSLVALVFWLVLRDRMHLWYAGCMATQMLYLLCSNGEAYSVPGLRLLGRFGTLGIWFVATLSTIVAVHFLLDFAELRTRVPRLSRLLLLVGAWLPGLLLVLLVLPWPAGSGVVPGHRQPVAVAGERGGDRRAGAGVAARWPPCPADAVRVGAAGGDVHRARGADSASARRCPRGCNTDCR